MNKKFFIFGSGGHGHVVADAVLNSCQHVSLILDDNPRVDNIYGINVFCSNDNWLPKLPWSFVVAIGDNYTRLKVYNNLLELGGLPINVHHPNSTASAHCSIGTGCVFLAGSIVNAGVTIANNIIINTGATIDHHCIIGDHSHICPGVNLGGNVKVGENSMVGVGSAVKPGVNIGNNCIIGAGSVVVSDLPNNSVSFGVPAKVIRYH